MYKVDNFKQPLTRFLTLNKSAQSTYPALNEAGFKRYITGGCTSQFMAYSNVIE